MQGVALATVGRLTAHRPANQNANQTGATPSPRPAQDEAGASHVLSHIWTQEAKDALTEALPGFEDTFLPDEVALIAAAIERTPLDTLLTQSEAEK